MLSRRDLPSRDTMHLAMNAAGGLYVVPASADSAQVRAEVLARGIRALEVEAGTSIEFVRSLPIEFLIVSDTDSAEPVGTLPGLRGLHLGWWGGELDFDALPNLEWFGTTEIQQGQLEPLSRRERPRLHHLAVGQYRFADVSPLRRLVHLTHVAIGDSRVFSRLDGLGGLSRLQHFSLYRCPKLESLAGVEEATGLEHLELESCNRITDLSPLARLRLRSVRIEMRTPPSLEGLVGHPSLEYLWIVTTRRPATEVVEQLLQSPRLRFVAVGKSCWLRAEGVWEHIPTIYAMSSTQNGVHQRALSEWNACAAW